MGDFYSGEAPRNVLSEETIRQALSRANTANFSSQPPLERRSTSSSKSSGPDGHHLERRSTGSKKSKQPPHENCDCIDCRDLSYRETLGAVRYDSNGDKVQEATGSSANPIHCHVQPGLFNDIPEPGKPKRSSTSSSTKSKSKSDSGRREDGVSYSKDKDGNLREEWNKSEAPALRPHWDQDNNAPPAYCSPNTPGRKP